MYSFRDEHIGRLFQSAYRGYNERVVMALHKMGYKDLTQFQAEIISYTSLEGTKINHLVATTQTTKQAVGEAVTTLVKNGYLRKKIDPGDKRTRLLVFTPLGEQFLLDSHRLKAELEKEYATLLGGDHFEQLQKYLQILASKRL